MLTVLRIAGPILLGYLVGGIPFGVIIARVVYHADITALGSGNTGGTNVYRNFGWKAGLAVAVLDIAKAAIPTAIGLLAADRAWGADAADWLAIGAGLAAAAGHSYSPYFRLKGGKAVSSFGGIVIVLMPWAAVLMVAFIALMIAVFRIVSVASILAATALPVVVLVLYPGRPALMAMALAAFVFIVWRHRSNIGRLLKGEEPRIGRGGLALRTNAERAKDDLASGKDD
ncbi:MAG: glycerol-3-phosphate 1-O-acyltransferase PlsY [Coriobacteriia bacterium]|nr:glycerol-3-phosphate 1-O-acyltransferase PlsY [Coriobacteriia bacterium]